MAYDILASPEFAERFDSAVHYRQTYLGSTSASRLISSYSGQIESLSLLPSMGANVGINSRRGNPVRWIALETYILVYEVLDERDAVLLVDLFYGKEDWKSKLQSESIERPMKSIKVVAAIIREGDKVLATQRGYGEYKDWWEFPGGKIESGETPEEAIVREIHEELAADIAVERQVCDISWDYPEFHLDMRCFLCGLAGSGVTLLEHEAAKWLSAGDIDSVNWLPADEQVVAAIREQGIV